MLEYKFYDTDPDGICEYNIEGNEYLELLQKCFQFCTTFSLYVRVVPQSMAVVPDSLEKYRIPNTEIVKRTHGSYMVASEDNRIIPESYELRHYRLCEESETIFLSIADSVFEWLYGWGYKNPEDPAFYREDGSVFFFSKIHEGECTILPREDEDVSTILSSGGWILQET